MSNGKLNVKPLITHRFDIEHAPEAYNLLTSAAPYLGIIIDYPSAVDFSRSETIEINQYKENPVSSEPVVSVIGSGNYAASILIPALKKNKAYLSDLASFSGTSSTLVAKKFGFKRTTTDADLIFQGASNTIVVCSRHDSHAEYVLKALQAQKHLFVEKPLCLTKGELEAITVAKRGNEENILMVGFNRRFSRFIKKIKDLLELEHNEKTLIYNINAGSLPFDHWVNDSKIGGGRLLGECCHFIDTLRFILGKEIIEYNVSTLSKKQNGSFSVHLIFSDQSVGQINYIVEGHKSFPKEEIIIYSSGSVLKLDNYKTLKGYGWKGFKSMYSLNQDKGQNECIKSFLNSIRQGKESPVPFEEILEVSDISINLAEELLSG